MQDIFHKSILSGRVLLALVAVAAMGCAAAASDASIADSHTVTFRRLNGTALSKVNIPHGGSLTPPAAPEEDGYTFKAWNHADWLASVTKDVTCWALYEKAGYPDSKMNIDSASIAAREQPYTLDEYFQMFDNVAWSDEFSESALKANFYSSRAAPEDGVRFRDGFHRIGAIVTDRELVWYVDDHIFKRMDITESAWSATPTTAKYLLLCSGLCAGGWLEGLGPELKSAFDLPGKSATFIDTKFRNDNGWKFQESRTGFIYDSERFETASAGFAPIFLSGDANFTNCYAVCADLKEKVTGARVKVVAVNVIATNGVENAGGVVAQGFDTLFAKLNDMVGDNVILFLQGWSWGCWNYVKTRAATDLSSTYSRIGDNNAWPAYQSAYAAKDYASASAVRPDAFPVPKRNSSISYQHNPHALQATVAFNPSLPSTTTSRHPSF